MLASWRVLVILILSVLKDIFDFYLGPPPRGVPGEGPDCHFLEEIGGFGPAIARIRGLNLFLIFMLALSTVGRHNRKCDPSAAQRPSSSPNCVYHASLWRPPN